MSNLQADLQFGEFVLSRRLRELRRRETILPVSGKTFDLLAYMVSNAGRPLSKSELLNAVWPETNVEEANLSQNVFLLRKVLGTGSDGPIKTLPSRGYQFAADVIEIEPVSVTGRAKPAVLPESTLTIEATQTRMVVQHNIEEHISLRPSRRTVLAAAAVLCLSLAAWLGWRQWQRWLDHTGGDPVQVVFTAMNGTTGDPVLDQTLIDALRMDLSQSPFVSVLSSANLRSTLAEMMHKPDDPVTPAIAREVCERSNSQAVLRSTIARTGQHFFLTVEATNCIDGLTIASAKQEAATAEELPHSIDRLADELRQKLGESRRSIARFNAPLFPERTASLEALKAYSHALHLAQGGKIPEAIALAKQAVSLDPNFAAAWLQLSVLSGNAGDYAGQRVYIGKAYELLGQVNQPTRLNILAMYNQAVTGDLYEAVANFESWTTLYPRASVPWSGLLQTNRELGRHAEAVVAGQHALELNPHSVTLYYGLALEQLHAGDARAARATCELALARGLDGDAIRGVLYRVAVVTGDDALRAKQTDWSKAHPNATYMLTSQASLAIAEGRLVEAKQLMDRAAEAFRRQGLNDAADATWRQSAPAWAAVGDQQDARLAMQHGKLDSEEPFEFLALEAIGDSARAESLMQAETARHPQATLTNHLLVPWLQAKIALDAHRPAEAIEELDRTAPLDEVFPGTRFDRGVAFLENNQFPEAEATFRELIAHPYSDVLSESLPLSWLNLARALAKQGKTAAADEAYKHFFSIWAHADRELPLMLLAHTEYAAVSTRR
jgi:DNA-binding winged helix-turn-helix (wHTH) protein/tetratricopeptide (TPR) repeat protein